MAVTVKLKVRSLKQLEVFMHNAIHDGTILGMQDGVAHGHGLVVEEIDHAKPYPAVDTGALRQSVQSEFNSTGGRIWVDAPYAAIINNGTRPFWPPMAPLAEWALRKGIAEDEDEAEAIARAIQIKFATFGMEPRHYFTKAMKRLESLQPKFIADNVEDEFKRSARRLTRMRRVRIPRRS